MPARAWASGAARVRSTPSNITRPPLGTVSPARQLKKVDLPAPLGPIRPTIWPCAIDRLAPSTATNLSNVLETFSASSSIAMPPPQPRRDAAPEFIEPAGLEPRDDDDDAAIENIGEAGT